MNNSANKIAVIGMACRFPGANNLEEYWSNLIEGKETLTQLTDEQIYGSEPYFDKLKNNPNYVKVRGILNDIDKFDAGFFGMTPKEAAETDPQQRLWFETVWHAFENAGCDPFTYGGPIGVFAGGNMSSYLLYNILRDPEKMENFLRPGFADSLQLTLGNEAAFIPTKTAYQFNLRGPAIYVQTACSTSLVAIAQACQSLYSYESDICVAGGVKVTAPQEKGYLFQEGAIYSPDGHCRSFDAEAKGTVGGNGVGVVILKRMEDALRDRDRIYSLVSGWGLNNDGNNKVSYTAPGIDGQAEVIMMAQAFAEVSPDEIAYVEAHGTATQLGDPIEVAALTKAFRAKTEKKGFCGLGSVKSNIGHTDSAAGVASFIKTSLAAYNKTLPPTLHFKTPNPHIDFANSPFYVQNKLKKWDNERPLIMGVSSFGIGGTNAHVIVEQPPVAEKTVASPLKWPELIVISAKSEESLKRQKTDLADYLKIKSDVDIRDVANTLAYGRNHMKYRSFVVASNTVEIASGNRIFVDGKKEAPPSKTTFMFPGQGAQYVKMGLDLYSNNKIFRNILDECFTIFRNETGNDLSAILFSTDSPAESEKKLASTEITQPSLLIIEYALSKVLLELGIKPDYLIGHSIGEYTAACLSGVFDLPSALRIVIKRGELMRKMPSGSMMAVRAGAEKLKALSGSLFELAADNAAESCTISFRTEDMDRVKELLGNNGITSVPLNTSHAFHSAAFDPIISEFSAYVGQFMLKVPRIPFISCFTGSFITNEQATSKEYWARQLRNTVRFRDGVSKLSETAGMLFLEVGPNTHLSSIARQSNNITNKKLIISTLGKADGLDERHKVISVLGNLFNTGMEINFEILQQGTEARKISLPSYPFNRKRHWIDYDKSLHSGKEAAPSETESQSQHVEASLPGIDNENTIKYGKTTVQILNIWRTLFGNDQIGVDDDFFEIGGHSLLALQILARIREATGSVISLKEFLDNSTVNKLNDFIGGEKPSGTKSEESDSKVDLLNYPLSYIQKRIWIVSKLDGANPAYNIPFAYKFTGEMKSDVMSEAINRLFHRHFIVFSTFRERDGEPYCVIEPAPVKVEMKDFSGDFISVNEDKLRSFIGLDTRRQFDLEKGPLFRIYLTKLSDSCYILHGTIHHMIFDGWSFSVFVSDLRKIYEGLLLNKEPEFEDVKEFYLGYARDLMIEGKRQDEGRSAEFWKENLRDCSPKLNFPYDFPRKEISSGFGEKQFITLSSEVTTRLKKIAREKHATPFASLLSLMGILFSKYSGENDICIGTHVANRNNTSMEKIFGMFVNTIPIRLKIDEKKSVRHLMSSAKDALLESISHQQFPFEKIVEVVNPERFANINPIFQVAVQWLNYSTKPLEMPGLQGERFKVNEGISPFDITFNLWENDGRFEGEIEYNIDILKRETIVRLKDNFVHLVNSVVENPEIAVSEVSAISENDRKMLAEFNKTDVLVPQSLVHELFVQQAALVPDKTALISGDKSLSYRELDLRSAQLASYLISLGVAGGDVVGICLERSSEMVVAALGILKAGCCYLPMDPMFPDDRIAYMYEDSGAKVLISQGSLKDRFRNFPETTIVLTDSDSEKISVQSMVNPERRTGNQSLAYMIYTSGSTGKPKGVKVHHEAVVNMLCSVMKKPGITDKDRLLAVTTLSFDISVLEVFLPLSAGASLIVAETDDIFDGQRLSDLLEKHDITILQATPATWNLLLGNNWKGKRNLKAFCGGEAILPGLVRELLPRTESFWDLYGPTETTVWSTGTKLTSPEPPILIGKPFDNTSIYILDKANNEVPVGVTGEVCIGGLGVTKGYNKRPELTTEKFIRFGEAGTIYKTGDVGRFLSNGEIELFGRMDNQIKLRGFRIEPGEIENLLSKLPMVQEAVVKIQKFDDNDERLVAFLNTEPGFSQTKEDISAYLSRQLPVYMVPAFFKPMIGFPRLPNGKINKKALLLDVDFRVTSGTSVNETLTLTQKKLKEIWTDVLKTGNISSSANFFDLGGTSLLAVRILNRIKESLGFVMTFKVFISNPTITAMGNYIDRQAGHGEKAISLVHSASMTRLPLTMNQKRLWLLTQLQPDIPLYIIPFTSKFAGDLNVGIFRKSLELLFMRHHTLYSEIKELDGEPYCDIIPKPLQIEYSDFSEIPVDRQKELVKEITRRDSKTVFNLEHGPLFRLYLIKTAPQGYIFHTSIHHIVFDGWSWGIFSNDLSSIYNSLVNGKEVGLEPLEFQQYDYARWEMSPESAREEESLKKFWKENLNGYSPVLNFPYDFPRKERPSGRGGHVTFSLSANQSEGFRALSKAEGTSLFSSLFSVYGLQMQKYSGEDDLNIGLPVAYRPHSKLENIFGMFVNTVVVRIKIEKEETFRELIRKTNDTAMNAIAHQDLAFDKVVEILKPERSSNANPIFQVAFTWQNNLSKPMKMEGLKCEKIPAAEGGSIFDISLYMWEKGDIIEGVIEYNTDILKDDTIVRFRDNFLTLADNLLEKSDIPVRQIPMISSDEIRMIETFNDTKIEYPRHKTVVQIFEEQARAFPEKTAVAFRNELLSYKVLNDRANSLARTLRNSGVTRNSPVGILVEKSLEMVVGILAILKAGGAYLAIDPDYPIQRINFILGDADCKLLLTQSHLMGLALEGVEKVNLNSSSSYHPDSSDIDRINDSEDLAYIIYTSGSTGVPKGSLIRHYSVIRTVINPDYMELTSDDRLLYTSAIVFDVTTFELWGPLLNGGTVYVIDKETILDPSAMGRELINNKITILHLTSALFTQIAEVRTDIFSGLKYLMVGGDVLSVQHINKVRRDNPGLKVLNCYGPSENTTFSTIFLIDKDYEFNVPIGSPISNSTVYIFDRNLNYQPIGVPGELYVGGDGLSKAYLKRDDLNRTSFIEHPYKPAERLYKSGDLARWLPDGNIEFRGRADNQIKIRGFRVELDEIEATISEIDEVVETVIKPVKVQEGNYSLIAFLNVTEKFNLDTKAIVTHIRAKLPVYMVPSAIKLMHGFPKTINGKTDRKALKYDISELVNQERKETTELTETEKSLLGIWCDLLKTRDIISTDNFFDVGGNSLMAISVFSRIKSTFNIELGLRIFFDSPRIKDLAEAIDVEVHKQAIAFTSIEDTDDRNLNIVSGEL